MNLGAPHIDPHVASQLVGTVLGGEAGKHPELYLTVAGAVLARILGFLIVAPFFGSMNIPMTVRVALASALTFVTVPYVYDDVATSLAKELAHGSSMDYLLLLVNQVLIGLMLGFCASFITYAVESAGRIIDTQRGSNMSGDVTVTFDNVPNGVSIDPNRITVMGNDTEAKFTVKASNEAPVGDFTVKVVGHPATGADATNEFKVSVSEQ